MNKNDMFNRDEEMIEYENSKILSMVSDTYGDLSDKEMDLCKIITDSNIVNPIFYTVDFTFAFDIMNIIYGRENNIHEKDKRKMVVNEDAHDRIVSFSTKIHIAFKTAAGIIVKTRLDIDSVFAYGCLTYKTSSVIIDGYDLDCSNVTHDEAYSTCDLCEDFKNGFFAVHDDGDYLDYCYMCNDIMLHFITMVAFPVVSIVSKKCNCDINDIDITKIDYICEEILKDNDNSNITNTKVLCEVHTDSVYSITKPCICDKACAEEDSHEPYHCRSYIDEPKEGGISKDTIMKYLNIKECELLSYIELEQSDINNGNIDDIVESVKMLIEMILFSNDDASTGIYKIHRIIPIEGNSGMHDYALVNKYFLDGKCRVEFTAYKYNPFTSKLEKYGSFDTSYEEFIEDEIYEFISSIVNHWQKITSNDMVIAITK